MIVAVSLPLPEQLRGVRARDTGALRCSVVLDSRFSHLHCLRSVAVCTRSSSCPHFRALSLEQSCADHCDQPTRHELVARPVQQHAEATTSGANSPTPVAVRFAALQKQQQHSNASHRPPPSALHAATPLRHEPLPPAPRGHSTFVSLRCHHGHCHAHLAIGGRCCTDANF